MNHMRHLISALLGLLALATLAIGCGSPEPAHTVSPVQTPTTRPTEPASPTPTPLPTATPEPSEAPPPTAAPEPTATPQATAIPSLQPYPVPEWTPYVDERYTVVYMWCGELWASEVGGRGEWQLTHEDMGTSERPCLGVGSFAVSPDGQSIAYLGSDGDDTVVKVMDIREGTTRVVGSTSPPFSVFPWFFQQLAWWDDTHIAYYLFEPPTREAFDATGELKSLELVNLETGETTTGAVSTLQYPSPDGRYVLSGHNFRGLDPHYQPYQLDDRETGERWTVTDAEVPARFLGWSPHGRLMLFDLNYERDVLDILVVVDAKTRMRQVITPEGKTTYPDAVAWSPDGQTIAYPQCDPPTTACMNPEVWLSSPDGANRRRIPMEESMHTYRIAWAPDGSRLVFETTRQPHIWSVRVDGTDLRPIANGQDPQVLLVP